MHDVPGLCQHSSSMCNYAMLFVEFSEEDESGEESGKDWDDLEEEARLGKIVVTLQHSLYEQVLRCACSWDIFQCIKLFIQCLYTCTHTHIHTCTADKEHQRFSDDEEDSRRKRPASSSHGTKSKRPAHSPAKHSRSPAKHSRSPAKHSRSLAKHSSKSSQKIKKRK